MALVGWFEVAESFEICGFLRESEDLGRCEFLWKCVYLLKKSEK